MERWQAGGILRSQTFQDQMKIGGLQKTSLIDYPGKISSIIFTSGCNFHCPFCHNGDLVLEKLELISEETIFEHLINRRDLLDGVVITGGEPTIHQDLPELIKKIKDLGFSIKLDTNGSNPQMLADLISESLIDYVAFDFKLPLDRYKEIGGALGEEVSQSIQILRQNPIEYEFRSTIVPTLITKEDLVTIGKQIRKKERWYLQQFQTYGCLDPNLKKIKPYKREILEEFLTAVQEHVPNTELRGL